MKKALSALGRLKPCEMNKTEQAYSQQLDLLLASGEIKWYKFESMKFRLADKTFYTPDFIVMNKRDEIEVHEVKGSMAIFQDDAKVKIKVAASLYPFKFMAIFPKLKKNGGGWETKEY